MKAHPGPVRLALLLTISALATPAVAQLAWRRADTLEALRGRAMTFDSDRRVVVTFGGGPLLGSAETWEWAGVGWQRREVGGPASRSLAAMTYDRARRRVVLYGGQFTIVSGDVIRTRELADHWEFDGAGWIQRSALVTTALSLPQMTFLGARSQVVLVGLDYGAGQLRTLTWDGNRWQELTGPRPPARTSYGLAEDVGRGRVILFGGVEWATQTPLDDTWEFDGTSWRHVATSSSPGPRWSHVLAGAAGGGVLLHGGGSPQGTPADTWRYDGSAWRRLAATVSPGPRIAPGAAYDPGTDSTLLLGAESDLWRHDLGTGWSEIAPKQAPPLRSGAALASDADRGTVTLFGGVTLADGVLDDTWSWDGQRWTEHRPIVRPPARHEHALANAGNGRMLLFGGRATEVGIPLLGDTWEWNGRQWLARIPVAAPSPRADHAMAVDPLRQRIVLFGGSDTNGDLDDTWEWDGTTWSQRSPSSRPSPRGRHAMAFDANRGRVVLYGGARGSFVALGDVWEFDGSDWRRLADGPSGRIASRLAFDEARRRLVLTGGFDFGPVFTRIQLTDTWDFDGSAWQLRIPQGPVPGLDGPLAHDPVRAECLMVAESTGTWLLAPTDPARMSIYARGCPGSAGTPGLVDVDGSLPWLGDTFRMRLERTPPNALAAVIFGGSSTSWSGRSLPLSLAGIGAPGCAVAASLDWLQVSAASAAGRLDLALAVPVIPALVGAELFVQAAVADAAANTLGLTVSDAARIRIGAR
ncbi:MAG: hypothetical protein IPM29_23045 [Planctomycetes bacterium]|nr:hypothetical protein [Planctomycetota bacterium]